MRWLLCAIFLVSMLGSPPAMIAYAGPESAATPSFVEAPDGEPSPEAPPSEDAPAVDDPLALALVVGTAGPPACARQRWEVELMPDSTEPRVPLPPPVR